jgi:hypothetical protein
MAKYIESIETDTVKLEVIKCSCGGHIGLDGNYLETSRDFVGHCIVMECPYCGENIETKNIPEVAVGLDARSDTKLPLRLS